MGVQGKNVEAMEVEVTNSETTNAENEVGDKKDVDLVTIHDLREHTRQIEKAVASKEPRFILRALRALPNTRRKLNPIVLRGIIGGFYMKSSPDKEALLAWVEEPMDMEGTQAAIQRFRSSATPLLPEIDAYIHLLILVRLIDTKKYVEAVQCSEALMQKIMAQNRRTIDLIAAKCYFYHSRAYELTDQLDKIRGFLHLRLRTATLRNDFEGQAVLINCLLRNYLHYNLYDQADKLVLKSTFPETASNNEWARFLYYLGRIKSARLEYSAAHKHLVQALRKAPQTTAVGFRQTVQKLAVTVELLLGDIPERQIFRQAALRKALSPYFQLTQAVRLGNLQRFGEVLENFGPQFRSDHTFTLILRLRHNVIKTAIRSIGLSYSRISPADIAKKLGLDSGVDAEFIVAKAIRDGVIEATLDPENGYMRSKETTDIYCTREPLLAFHQRITFCLDLHNQSVKAMRYPPKSYGKDLESAEERREREQQDLELAKEMAEEDDDGFP
ncbi:probable 26S proteasome non-ATPase regulatory subunit 3 [Copidosoma floridanum]|uniref:probable 26S proteasome non-ATPase regulatory subunit 3 n=1 Tax=Copidosoma floridanum TaxID=29053 RepID=UPI0006C9CBD5|nr:probable 26S proteasome non-ATPase regulatory subunit 3 [Copidosoma floridanum]XP_014212252.1 probable 26S proteasome non-ATPase regulatory subunit 3 [Copidosoma floridanum]XP_014212253.1 probable 26S proteasome non-ATPase regulatory subunit 3 [Copidosoma floridanum]XP_014212255.1 probable 26S proteasome non-ATPase regulatory subunit 3 [Copidosoma floridanum]